jgi:hypothetical protein
MGRPEAVRAGGSVRSLQASGLTAGAGREAVRAGASVGRSAFQADCPAVLGPADLPPNSLRSLRSLRSNSGGKDVDEARCARGRHALRSSAPHRRASTHHLPPRVWSGFWMRRRSVSSNRNRVAFANSAPHSPRRLGRRLGAPVECRGAQAWSPARASAPCHPSRRRCLSGAPCGRAASSAAGTPGRAPQGSRPKGPAAPPKRPGACRVDARAAPGQPEAATHAIHRP